MATVLVAPSDAKDIILLPHPRTSKLCQFLVTDSNAVCEILTFGSSTTTKQSLFLSDYIVGTAPLYIATPFDVTFFLIAILNTASTKATTKTSTTRYVETDELLDLLPIRIRSAAAPCLPRVCEALEGSRDEYWRFSRAKAVAYIREKVERVKNVLPPSILDQLPSTPAAPERVVSGAREKAAWELISSYVPDGLAAEIALLYDFSEVVEYLAAQHAAPEVFDPSQFVRRPLDEDSPNGQFVADAKRKNVKKRSKGVEALKKVNTKGMASISSFFAKPKVS